LAQAYQSAAQGMRPLRASFLLLCAAGLAVLVPLATHGWLFLITILMALCLIGPAALAWQRDRFDAFEIMHVLGFRYLLYFGIGALWMVADPYEVAYDYYLLPYVTKAALYCLLGYVCMLGGYYGPWFRKREPREFEDLPTGASVLLLPGVLGVVGNMADTLMGRAFWMGANFSGVLSSMAQLAPLYYFSWALAWLLVLSGRATPIQKWILYLGFIPITLLILVNNLSDKSQALTLIVVPLMALWYARRVLPWRSLLVVCLIMIFFIFPFYNNYRMLDPRLSLPERASTTMNILTSMDGTDFLDESLGTFKRRVALINSVAIVIRDVPRWVPYEHGDTLFVPAMAFFVPRFIWPDKPLFMMGRDFGVKFRIVNIFDEKTRIAVTVPGELYWNFDLPGILFGMALWGVVVRLVYRRYAGSVGLDPVRRAIYMLLLIQFVHFGGGIAGQAVGLIRTLILLEVFCWVCRRLGLIQSIPVEAVQALTQEKQPEYS
jgi:hypothetical protein